MLPVPAQFHIVPVLLNYWSMVSPKTLHTTSQEDTDTHPECAVYGYTRPAQEVTTGKSMVPFTPILTLEL
jgi:hypothetical protein